MNSANRYDGTVWVVVDDVEHTLMAMLKGRVEKITVETFGRKETLNGLTSWGGTLVAESEEAAQNLARAGELLLRTEDGREGTAIVSGHSAARAGRLSVTGSGPPPFDLED